MSGENLRQRLAAILAADVAGYSRLMSVDERGTVAALDAARAVFRARTEANRGHVIDMAGDSVLAVFDTAAGAVIAALAIQRSLEESSNAVPDERRMRFRIGVHLGDVIEKADGTVYGDGVNIAARLETLAEPGGVAVSQSIRNAVKGKVEAAFEDLGKQAVKNIAEPVRAYRIETGAGNSPAPKRSAAEIDLSLPDKPSIAVLPFNNMSGDPEQEYFTDGVTEDIITELSRSRGLFVIARNSSFTYKGRSVDVRTVAKELGVRYVLEGSIRKAANRIRVTAQLIDALTGSHVWAEKYDRVLEDVFEVQEEVTLSIIAAIGGQILAAEMERARRRRPGNLTAYEIAARAWAIGWDAMSKPEQELRDQVIANARRALAIDPRCVPAMTALGFAHWQSLVFSPAIDRAAAFADGIAALTKAIEIDPAADAAYVMRAWLLQLAPDGARWDEALRSARRAHELNPNSTSTLQVLGHIEGLQGNWARGVDLHQTALRISPRDPFIAYTYQGLSLASCCTGAYADGVEYAQQGIRSLPGYGINYGYLAINRVGLGELDAARAAFVEARRLAPGWIDRVLNRWAALRRPEDARRCVTFMRVAGGLEEPPAADALR